MLFFQCSPRFTGLHLIVLAAVVSLAGVPAISFADEPRPDAATLEATEKEAMRGVLSRE